MNTSKSTTEMLDDLYRSLPTDGKEPAEEFSLKIDEKISNLEILIREYEKAVEDTENALDREVGWSKESTSTENANEREESSAMRFPPVRDTRKAKLKAVLSLLRSKEEFTESLWVRVMQSCLKNHRVIEFLQILTEKGKEDLIQQLFCVMNPVELKDYEDCIFVLGEYLTRASANFQFLFRLLQFCSYSGVYQLYPIFSLALRKLTKANRLTDATLLLNYVMAYRVEISTCAINFFIETLCRLEKIEEAQGFFTKVLAYKPMFVFPGDILENCRLTKLVLTSGVNIITYGTLIKCLCKSNHMDLALFYYQSLKDQDMIKDEVIFNLLIDGCSKTSNLDQLRHLYFDMLTMNVTPTIVTFNTIIDAYIRARDINSAWKIYDDIFKKKK